MDRCPNCRARWDGGETCRRCGMDLAPLLVVEQAAEGLIGRAVAQLAGGDVQGAVRTLEQARALNGEPMIGHLLGFARGLVPHPPPGR
jgi:hypothetical protein